MKMICIHLAVLKLIFTVNIARAQLPVPPEPSYTPYSAATGFVSRTDGEAQGPKVTLKTSADLYLAPGLGCTNVPSPRQTIAAGFTYHSRVLSTADAVRLNIPFYASGSGK